MEFVLIGKIINTHGVKGELKVESHTDFIDSRFKPGSKVYLSNEQELIVKSYRMHKGFILVTFETYEDINLVLKFKGQELYINVDDITALNEGEYYFKDLKNLDVYVEEQLVGKVMRVEEGTKYNYLRIKVKDKEVLVPYLKAFVKNVNLELKRIDIVKMEGLL